MADSFIPSFIRSDNVDPTFAFVQNPESHASWLAGSLLKKKKGKKNKTKKKDKTRAL